MGAKKTADIRRLVVVTACIAVVIVIGLTIALCNVLTTSDTVIDGFGVAVFIGSGCLAALFASVSLFSWYVVSCCDPADSHSIVSLLIQLVMWLILSRRGRAALSQLSVASRALPTTQTRLLLDVIRRNKSTMFGRANRFQSIQSRADYISTVPLSTYACYSEYVDKIIANDAVSNSGRRNSTGVELSIKVNAGENTPTDGGCSEAVSPGVLTADTVEFLACSAGTSGKNKIVPVTSVSKTLASHFVGPLSFHIADKTVSGGGRPYLQRVLNLSYKAPVGQLTSSGLSVGPISAYIGRRIPHVVSPPEVYELVTDEPTALHIHAVFGLAEREIGHVEALFSTLVYSFWKHVEQHWPTICDQIESGRLAACFDTDNRFPPHHCRYTDVTFSSPTSARTASILNAVGKHLRADPERAAQLRREFSSAAGFNGIATRVWPGLKAVRMTATGSFAHHASRLADVYMSNVRQLSLVHAASEGFYGVGLGLGHGGSSRSAVPSTVDDDALGMMARYTILPTVGFYEFIPVDQLDSNQPVTLFAEQVSLGESYELVYTSQTGLYRYRTGDIIKIVDFFNQCPVYEFLYRVGQTLNVFWEKTPESVLYEAVRKTISCFKGVQLVDYTSTEDIFAPQLADVNDTMKHYVLFIETERGMEDVILSEEERRMFDMSLRETFELYAACRATGSIGSMRVYQVARGTFIRLKQHATLISTSSMSAVGSFPDCSNPQYKTPRVVRDPSYVKLLVAAIVP